MDIWARDAQSFQEERRHELTELMTTRSQYEQLKQLFERDRIQILGNPERNQLHDYLRRHRIEDARIESIGPKRKAILLACGLETALDIHDANMMALRGQRIGPEAQGKLRNWRVSVEASFKFDPSNIVLPEKLRTVHARYQPRRAQLRIRLEAGPQRVLAITNRAKVRLAELETQTAALVRKLGQSQADIAAMNY
jgi:DNA-binding helix-hairpin-helix protein with protein kinase domain